MRGPYGLPGAPSGPRPAGIVTRMLRESASSPAWAWVLAGATTLLAVLESTSLPWAPFLILYALLLPLPAWIAGTARFGPWGPAFSAHPAAVIALSLAILAWEIGLMGFLYEACMRRRVGISPVRVSPSAAMGALLQATARHRGLALRAVQTWSAAYFLLWAPVAEELFFWGFLYPAWRPAYGAVGTAALVAVWFAARHGTHFLFLRGPYPWPAALAFMASAGGAAYGNGLLFEACGSLWPLIVLHFASNLIALAIPAGKTRPDPGA
jgi:membrane protease YdiL (CAAX protease family)